MVLNATKIIASKKCNLIYPWYKPKLHIHVNGFILLIYNGFLSVYTYLRDISFIQVFLNK
jgi:hypothetical protein